MVLIYTALDKQKKIHCKIVNFKIVNILLPINFSICFGCSKELAHWDSSFECPQHMFWLRNKKIIFLLHTDKDYCPIEIIKGLTDKGQFQ